MGNEWIFVSNVLETENRISIGIKSCMIQVWSVKLLFFFYEMYVYSHNKLFMFSNISVKSYLFVIKIIDPKEREG